MSFAERPASTSIPTGTVTFMFSDIEGSTVRWERDRAAMTQAVRLHDAIMREAIAAQNGYVFKTIGDAFCAAFHRPEDAANATLAAQRALLSADFAAVDGIRVRMAVHIGTADERDGDYFGPTVNRVARLLAIGHGGQVLMSGATADLVRGSLASQATLADLGEHRLKDLARPEHVFALLAADLPTKFPPLRSLDVLANNLPLQLTSFIGRESEVVEITELLAHNRLVTLVGSGGIGKTRTSLQVAANLLDGGGDGVWFIELAPLTSAAYIPATIALTLGLKLANEGDPIENLVRLLSNKKTLLVFDNCEHLVEGAAQVVSALVRGCPRLVILASSRQGLGVAGEVLFRIPTLPLPARADAGVFGAAEAARHASIMLFVERARAVDQRFALTDENAPIVADICRRLDGIALAIELAAPRVKILNPRQLRDRLDERFRVLTGGSRDVLPRQQTLRALIDWSHDLLDERERALFRRLSIFVDGFTIDGATAVGSGENLDEFDVFDLLASLVDKSLVLAEPGTDAVRYRLLESTRAYGREKLAAAGENERIAKLHLQYVHDMFLERAQSVETTAQSADIEAAWMAEREDARAALDFGLQGPVSLGAALLVSITESSRPLGLGHEFSPRAEAYLAALGDHHVGLRARLWVAMGAFADNDRLTIISMEAMSRALTCAREADDARILVWVLANYAESATRCRRFDDADSALVEGQALPNLSARARILLLGARGHWLKVKGERQAALGVRQAQLLEYRRVDDVTRIRSAILNLAECHHSLGNTQRAIELVEEVLPSYRESSNGRAGLIASLTNLTGYLAATGELSQAIATAHELINLVASAEPASLMIAGTLEHLALVHALQGDLRRAALLEGYADAALRRAGDARDYTETTSLERLRAKLAESFAPDELERLLADGAALAPQVAIRLAQGEMITQTS